MEKRDLLQPEDETLWGVNVFQLSNTNLASVDLVCEVNHLRLITSEHSCKRDA